MKCRVRKVRPSDPGFGTVEAEQWPWLAVLPNGSRDEWGYAFATHKQALHYALTGERLKLSFEERLALRNRPQPLLEGRRAESWARRQERRAAATQR